MRKTSEISDPSWQDIRDRDEKIQELQAELDSIANELKGQTEHANLHYSSTEFIGIDGYGPFSLKQLGKDQWEIRMLRERVVLYNRKGRRVRSDLNASNANYDGDW